MKRLPIGVSDYKKMIEGDYYYVDKTLFIKEILEKGGEVTIIPRPRRFGKTLNLSMLHYFFERTDEDKSHLFSHTAIWKDEKSKEHFGQYPVIYLTFKAIKQLDWESCYEKITNVIAVEFSRHRYLIKNETEIDIANKFNAILNQTANQVAYEESLLFLSGLLYAYHKKQVIILIDEYDAPIHAAYLNGYYQKLVGFIRNLLTAALKDNNFLKFGVVTGILRAAKEGIFSGLNNPLVSTILSSEFQDKFGFTQDEVKSLLSDQGLLNMLADVKDWYDGYTFRDTQIYNPWSIISCAYQRGDLKTYWLNTSDNQLIKNVLIHAGEDVKSDLELLLVGQSIDKEVEEAVIIPGIERNSRAVWSLLLFTGYLTYSKQRLVEAVTIATLTIPNKEIKILYAQLIKDVFEQSLTSSHIQHLFQALTTGDSATFQTIFQDFIINSMSYWDLPENEAEKSYHLFVLGLLVLLHDSYEVSSNRDPADASWENFGAKLGYGGLRSGYGRYDIMLIPRQPNKLGIVMEFKKVSEKETLDKAADEALAQIKEKQYVAELRKRGIKSVQLIGIAFEGKKILVKSERI